MDIWDPGEDGIRGQDVCQAEAWGSKITHCLRVVGMHAGARVCGYLCCVLGLHCRRMIPVLSLPFPLFFFCSFNGFDSLKGIWGGWGEFYNLQYWCCKCFFYPCHFRVNRDPNQRITKPNKNLKTLKVKVESSIHAFLPEPNVCNMYSPPTPSFGSYFWILHFH